MSNKLVSIENLIYGVKPAFESVLVDRGVVFEREAEFAIQAILASDFATNIARQNQQSVIDAVTNVAAIGISLNPAKKQAYLVPRKGGICLSISYMGLMDMAMESGSIKWGQARLVYEADTFRLNGLDRQPTHEFNPFSKDRGEVVGVYVSVKTADGDYLTEAMSTDEINAIRERSDSWAKKKSGPWATDWGEMAKKTVVHRAHKYWPKTDRLENAIHYLNTDAGEGIVMSSQPAHDEEMTKGLIEQASKCANQADLTALWQSGLAQIKPTGDMKAYSEFRAAVEKRGAELKADEDRTVENEA